MVLFTVCFFNENAPVSIIPSVVHQLGRGVVLVAGLAGPGPSRKRGGVGLGGQQPRRLNTNK